ncbi:MAG: hypothetical protein U0T82_14285 [Bacteroidales bacterium]
MTSNLQQEFFQDLNGNWNNVEEAMEVLDRFCLVLNFYYQGNPVDVDMPDTW